ncbi:MAG: YgiT-type zinc finger protein [Chloroflexi bacterium]|nr:YgiT-type zinc finger protein [Chloroflexota bacterium]
MQIVKDMGGAPSLVDGKPVVMENIPAQVCARCAEEIFSRETTEKVRLIVLGRKKSLKSVQMDAFTYAYKRISYCGHNIG